MPAPGQSAPCPRPCRFIASIGGAATVVCSRTRAAALPTDRPICNARVPQAIGQSFDWLVPAEAEVLGARLTDRPATSLGRDRPRRFIWPMTALRVTPISRAIWLHERPAWRQRFSITLMSSVKHRTHDWDVLHARQRAVD